MTAGTLHLDHCRAEYADIADLREQGAHRWDPARFRYLEVLSRKAGEQSGALRLQLEGQLTGLITAYRARFVQARSESENAIVGLTLRHPQAADDLRRLHGEADFRAVRRLAVRLEALAGPGPLGLLVCQMDGQVMDPHPADTCVRHAIAPTPLAEPLTELKTLRHFRGTWTRLRVDRQMARSQQQAPENPGPLNSHLLVIRTLRRMHEISPAYLARFMAHVDALAWLDQAKPGGAAAPGKAARQQRDKRPRRDTQPVPRGRSRPL